MHIFRVEGQESSGFYCCLAIREEESVSLDAAKYYNITHVSEDQNRQFADSP